jgi:hypothetical protein
MPSLDFLIVLAIFVDVFVAGVAWALALWIVARLLH